MIGIPVTLAREMTVKDDRVNSGVNGIPVTLAREKMCQ